MKKFISFFACLLFLCAFVEARAPLESYKRYMIVLVHGVGSNTMIPHEYTANPKEDEKEDAPRKSAIWDNSKDDILSENWFGNIGGHLQSRGLLGHVVWYDFYEPWKSPILDKSGSTNYGVSLSQYLGDRNMQNNPMGLPHKNGSFGRTAQSFWLEKFFPNIVNSNNYVTYGNDGSKSFLELAQVDWSLWNQVQQQAGFNNEEKPKKYLLIAHSMGGLTTRDYITGDFYKGDVDKLITLDSPHEGSAIANYVQYWKKGAEEGKDIFKGYMITLAGEMFGLIPAASLAQFLMGSSVTAPTWLAPLLLGTTVVSLPALATSVGSTIGHFAAGYDDVENVDTGIKEDHSRYGIDVMALDDKNSFGLYQSDTKQFLKDFNNRSSLVDVASNGYQLPYFRVVSTSGIPTPGGPGFHKYTNTPAVGLVASVIAGIFPYAFEGESGSFGDISGFNTLFKTLTATHMNSLWNDWGSGFVPHWSGEGKNVKIFNNPKADTKRWNIPYTEKDNSGLIGTLAGVAALEAIAGLNPWDNPGLKSLRFFGYVATVTAFLNSAEWERIAHIPSIIGFHGVMAKRVDENKATDAPSGRGSNKKMIDELLWEKPSVSIVYKPVDPQDRDKNTTHGWVGFSTSKELVEYTKSSIKNENNESVVDVKWKGETAPHEFDLSLQGVLAPSEITRQKTINIVGWHPNTTIKGIILNKVGGGNTIKINAAENANVCSEPLTSSGWTVVKANEGSLSCEVPLNGEDKGKYTMQLVVEKPIESSSSVTETPYGVMVDVGRIPGAAFVEAGALFDVQDGDWDRYITFKNRRKQVKVDGSVDENVADMVDYRRATNLVVNKLPRLIEFEVDDLQPDRMNRLSIDFNYGTAKIEFAAKNDPNNFDAVPSGFDEDAVSHGFVNTKEEMYRMTVSIGSQSCETDVKNPVDAWGKWNIDLDDIQKKLDAMTNPVCIIKKYQPFLEGQNHIRVFSENRWMMTRTQDMDLFIPGPPPTISLVYPRDGEVFCGPSKLEFETNLIYGLSSDLKTSDLSVSYIKNGQKENIDGNDLIITPIPNSLTGYSVSTKNAIDWPLETVVSITVNPRVLGYSASPYTYKLKISQDCVAPTVEISSNLEKFNPTAVEFESYDQISLNGEKRSVQDEIIEIKSPDGTVDNVLSAIRFTAPGTKNRSIELKDGAGNDLPDGTYELSVRVHDDVVKDAASEKARLKFWKSYQPMPDMSEPFATYCNDGDLTNASSCMTHWKKDTKEIIIDRTAPTIENPEFVLKQNNQEFVFNNRYAGLATNKDLVLKMSVSDANLDDENKPEASIEFIQINMIGMPVQDGHSFAQKMEGEYKNGKFVYNHDVIKALTEDLKNSMNGQQPVPDGIYAPVIKVVDAAKNVAEKSLSPIFVDMTAPMITELSVPYTVKSGSMHIITFKADELSDDQSMQRLGDVHASVSAQCGDQSISYGQVSAIEKDSKIKFAFEAVIPANVKGACTAIAEVFDGNGNVRKGELSFVVDFIPPEITYPEKSTNGNVPELSGRVVIRGSAGNPNLRAGGSFTKYELSYAEIDEESSVVGNWEHLGMTVPEGRRCNNPTNVSCSAVDKNGAGDDILGYWDLSKLPDNAKGKTYRIKVETFNEGGYSESDYVDVYVPTTTKSMPSITISGSTPNQCDFTDKDATCSIRWNTDFPLELKKGQVRMEILRINTKNQSTFVDVERIFSNVIPKEYYGAPNNTSAKGAYLWIDRNDLNKDENIYHLRLVAGQSATTYTILFSKTKNAVVKIFADGNNTEDLSQSVGEQYSSLNVTLNAGEIRSYVIKSDAKSQIAWNLQGSIVKTGDATADMKFMYTQDPNQDELAFVGQNSSPLLSMLKQSEVFLPSTSSIDQFIWDGKNDAVGFVPTGAYRIVLTLEGLEDGVYDVASKDITVIGKPVVLSNVKVTPEQVPFNVSYMSNSILNPVKVSFTFNIDQDAIVTAFVRSTDGNQPTRELMKLDENGRKTLLDQFYLAGRKDNYQVNWNGNYNNTSQALPGDYEFVVQIHGADGNIVNEKKVAFKITDDHMLVDGDVVLKVDGNNDPQNNHLELEGTDYQVVDGMTDAILQFAPAGKTVVTDNVNVKVKYSGTQSVSALPFERYTVGVQVHKTSAQFWVAVAFSFTENAEEMQTVEVGPFDIPIIKYHHVEHYTNKIHRYGPVTFVENGEEVVIASDFDAGTAGTDQNNQMRVANAALFFIPTYMMTEAEFNNLVDNGSFQERYTKLREKSVAYMEWGDKHGAGNTIEVTKCQKHPSLCPNGIWSHDGEENDIFTKQSYNPTFNSSSIYWDERCDLGTSASECLIVDDDNLVRQQVELYCAQHPAPGCGNRMADEGEPLRGTAERYNKDKYSAQFTARAWAWRHHLIDPPGPVGKGNHNMVFFAKVKPTDLFWGGVNQEGKVLGYGNGNLVNRYLTLDPLNDFLFCDACDFSGNKTPYLNPNHPQFFDLVDPNVHNGNAPDGQYFIAPLHNPNFHPFQYVNGKVKFYNSLADVQLIFHYFQIAPNKGSYASTPYLMATRVYQPGVADYTFASSNLGGYVQHERSSIPISLNGYSGLGGSLTVGIAFASDWKDGFNKSKNELPAPWPLLDASSVQDQCGTLGCGSMDTDLEVDKSSIDIETEGVECQGAACYKVYALNVTLGSQGLDNGFDLTRHLSGLGSTVANDNPMVTFVPPDIVVSSEYWIDGNIVRKKGCSADGCDYIASQDALMQFADFDDDGRVSEDGSVVSLGKRDAYDGSLDSDKDLAMGEDPVDAFRVRIPDMTFNFLPGAQGSETNLREIRLGELATERLSVLQANATKRGKIPGTVSGDNTVFTQYSSGAWGDNPEVKTQWESSNIPSNFTRTKLFYKDGKVNDDVKIFKSVGMDDYDAMQGKIWIGPNDFNGRDRRLLEVHATIPGMQAGEDYKLYASSEIGWIDLTPSTRVTPDAQGFDGLLAYWDVETSGMHQLMLVRTVGGEKKYKAIDVFVGAVANSESDKTLFSDAMGRSQVKVASGSPRVDVIPLGKDEVPQIIPSNKNLGPVVKIYPAVSTLEGNVELRLRFNRNEVKNNGWTNTGSMYVVSDGYSPQRVDGLTFEYYDDNNRQVTSSNTSLSSTNWSYVIISGTVNNNGTKKSKQASVQLGESATLDDATVSVTETSDGVYNVDFNLDANP